MNPILMTAYDECSNVDDAVDVDDGLRGVRRPSILMTAYWECGHVDEVDFDDAVRRVLRTLDS